MDAPFHCHQGTITFGDTDASGWMHFTNAFHHVEMAEHACLHKLGLLVFARDQGGWPRVSVSCDYHRPLLCGDNIEVHLAIATLGNSSVTWRFEILTASGDLAADGVITTVRVDCQGRPQPLSPAERAALEQGFEDPF